MHRRLIVAVTAAVVLTSAGAAGAVAVMAASPPCSDGTLDCLNQRVTALESRVSALEGGSTSPTATPTGTPASPTPSTTATASDGVQAAKVFNWGPVVAGDEFGYTGSPNSTKWNLYNSPGHNGAGVRSPAAWNVANGAATVTGDPNGTTGGMSANFDRRKYGRWEARMRTNVRDPKYHPVMILWPDAGGSTCPEIDYGEGTANTAVENFFLHYGCSGQQSSASRSVDTTVWHNYAVQWTSTGIIGYLDGAEWFRDTNTAHLPPASMHQTIQLDWFPDGSATRQSTMSVDWVRVYDVTGSTPSPTPSTTTSPTRSPTPSTSPTPTPTSTQTGDLTVAAVGDTNPDGNAGTTSASGLNAGSIRAAAPDAILHLGDLQYTYGSCASDLAYVDKAGWGALLPKLYGAAGPTHDWDATNSGGQQWGAYMSGSCPGQTSGPSAGARVNGGTITPQKSYSWDMGNWHFISLSSGCWRNTSVCSTSATTSWLSSDLTAADSAGKHVLAFWHEPYWTSTTSEHGPTTAVKPWIDLLSGHRVKLLLNGHQHAYERFYPQNSSGTRDDANGIQEMIVGTGGIGFYPFSNTAANVATHQTGAYGWMKLTLHANGTYAWAFQRTSGSSYTDSGSR